MKEVLRGKFIALSAQLKKTEKAHIGELTAYLKALDKKKKKHRKQSKESMKQKAGSWRKSTRSTNLYPK